MTALVVKFPSATFSVSISFDSKRKISLDFDEVSIFMTSQFLGGLIVGLGDLREEPKMETAKAPRERIRIMRKILFIVLVLSCYYLMSNKLDRGVFLWSDEIAE